MIFKKALIYYITPEWENGVIIFWTPFGCGLESVHHVLWRYINLLLRSCKWAQFLFATKFDWLWWINKKLLWCLVQRSSMQNLVMLRQICGQYLWQYLLSWHDKLPWLGTSLSITRHNNYFCKALIVISQNILCWNGVTSTYSKFGSDTSNHCWDIASLPFRQLYQWFWLAITWWQVSGDCPKWVCQIF